MLGLVSSYGYLFLFVASLAENVFLLGFIIPGDLVVVLGGGLAQRAGLSPVYATLAVVLGVLLGSNLSFLIGRHGGNALIERWGERLGVGQKREAACKLTRCAIRRNAGVPVAEAGNRSDLRRVPG